MPYRFDPWGIVLKRHKDLACRRVSKHHRGFATPRGGKLTDSTPKENVFRIAIKNGVVRYYRNGARIYHGKSIALPSCQSVCRARIIPAHNLGHFGTLLYTILWGISGHAPRPKSDMPHGSNHGAFPFIYQSPSDLIAIPTFTEKLGHFGIQFTIISAP
jgi:hypothetical protein